VLLGGKPLGIYLRECFNTPTLANLTNRKPIRFRIDADERTKQLVIQPMVEGVGVLLFYGFAASRPTERQSDRLQHE